MDVGAIHQFLTTSYWAAGIDIESVKRSISHSLPFAILQNGSRLAAFGRVISDRTTFAYVADVFVIEDLRGKGLGTMLMQAMLAHPELQSLRAWGLKTRDAQKLYEQFGFDRTLSGSHYMQRAGTLPPDYRRERG